MTEESDYDILSMCHSIQVTTQECGRSKPSPSAPLPRTDITATVIVDKEKLEFLEEDSPIMMSSRGNSSKVRSQVGSQLIDSRSIQFMVTGLDLSWCNLVQVDLVMECESWMKGRCAYQSKQSIEYQGNWNPLPPCKTIITRAVPSTLLLYKNPYYGDDA
eukprot:CAMPEP_0206414916 /NCGR_PEP_ID=MMETSP0294-20121207/35711_1 /ASSEMBLY_ACC=CAM_ASM_000327 /TAXON_ID=39354 /ORGANISM="Heterosigma akashiwo, Strain CCMP2393" /LENGTH=159 /DNA_ID=CAMNT_0053877021 /DNA_START=122 /DNA_END=601 /DNA_ORIENTATION=-